jgi:hypothetical protein
MLRFRNYDEQQCQSRGMSKVQRTAAPSKRKVRKRDINNMRRNNGKQKIDTKKNCGEGKTPRETIGEDMSS